MSDPGVPKPLKMPSGRWSKMTVAQRSVVLVAVFALVVLLGYGCNAAFSGSSAGAVDACRTAARSALAGPDDFTETTFTKDEASSVFVKGRVGRYQSGTAVTVKYWECTATKNGGDWAPEITFSSDAA